MKAYIKTALRRRLCLEYSYFDKIPPCTRVIAKQRGYTPIHSDKGEAPDRN